MKKYQQGVDHTYMHRGVAGQVFVKTIDAFFQHVGKFAGMGGRLPVCRS